MADRQRSSYQGHDIEVGVDDQGEPSVTVDGQVVSVRRVDGGFAVTYFEPHEDLMVAAKRYVDRLP